MMEFIYLLYTNLRTCFCTRRLNSKYQYNNFNVKFEVKIAYLESKFKFLLDVQNWNLIINVVLKVKGWNVEVILYLT